MLCPPTSPDPIVTNWLARHHQPFNFGLHMIGIPLTVLGVLLIPVYLTLFSLPIFLFAFVLFDVGYGLQFLGHLFAWSEPGEIRFLREWLSKNREAS